jgi:hypothetical protein
MNEQQTESGEEKVEGFPDRLLKTGRSLVDEEEVVVAEVNGLAYPDGVLVEIAWRYNKYPGLELDHDRLRKAVTTHRSHDRISGTGILRRAAEQVDSQALARDLMAMAADIDAALSGRDLSDSSASDE